MCWSGEASATLAAVGIATTAYAAYKKEPPELYIPLAYFSLMEVLQAFTYSVIDSCGLPANQIATYLGWLHITFQPFFVNYLCMYFIPKHVRAKIEIPVYVLCFIGAIIMLVQVYPFAWSPTCTPGTYMCGAQMCSVHGNWHIAWQVPYNTIWIQLMPYLWTGILLPFFYGSWRMALYATLTGPVLSFFLTNNNNERPAVWCLLSIGILLVVLKTPLRKWLHVRKWLWWPLLKPDAA